MPAARRAPSELGQKPAPGAVAEAAVPRGAVRAREDAGAAVFQVGSGTWEFVSVM